MSRIAWSAGSFVVCAALGNPGRVQGATIAQPSDATPAATSSFVDAKDLEVVEHTVSQPPRGKTPEEDFWIQFQIWGEMKNRSNRTVRAIAADVTFFDAEGRPVIVDAIATAAKRDAGDTTPGDIVWSEVHTIPPGGTAPFHYMRNLRAIKGAFASHKVTPRRAIAVANAPNAVAVGLAQTVAEMSNPALPETTTTSRMRAFEGTLKNLGPSACRAPRFVVALLSPQGKIREVDAFDARASENWKLELLPQAEVRFKGAVHVGFDDAWREKAAIRTYVDCEVPR